MVNPWIFSKVTMICKFLGQFEPLNAIVLRLTVYYKLQNEASLSKNRFSGFEQEMLSFCGEICLKTTQFCRKMTYKSYKVSLGSSLSAWASTRLLLLFEDKKWPEGNTKKCLLLITIFSIEFVVGRAEELFRPAHLSIHLRHSSRVSTW